MSGKTPSIRTNSTGRARARFRVPLTGELLLKAVLLEGEEAVRAWTSWNADGRLEQLGNGAHGLLPAVYRNLAGTDAADLERLRGAYRHSWYRGQIFLQEAGAAIGALAAAGVPTVVLNGAGLALSAFGDLGARPVDDSAILVAPGHVSRAHQVLEQNGWRGSRAPSREMLAVSCGAAYESSSQQQLQLRWRAFPRSRTNDDDLWAAAIALTLGDAQTRTPAPADQLLLALADAVAAPPVSAARSALDAAIVLRAFNGAGDWERLCASARRHRLAYTAADVLSYLGETLPVDVSPEAVARLQRAPTSRVERSVHGALLRPPPSIRRSAWVSWDSYRGHAATLPPGGRGVGIVAFVLRRWGVTRPRDLLRLVREYLAGVRRRGIRSP